MAAPGGRGGRGLALMQQMAARRVGASPAAPAVSASSVPPADPADPAPAESDTLAARQMLPARGRGTPVFPEPSPVTTSMPLPPTVPSVGRGRGAQALLFGKPQLLEGTAEAPSVVRPKSPAPLPHAGKPVSPLEAIPPGVITSPAMPMGRGGGRGAAGLALVQQRKLEAPTAPSALSSSPASFPAKVSSVVPTPVSSPPSTCVVSTTGSGTTPPTTRQGSTTSGSASGLASGSTTTSGGATAAQTVTSSVAKMHLKHPRGPPVVKKGDCGKPCPMQTNYIRIKTEARCVYQYHVSFDPPIDARNIRFALMKQHKAVLGPVTAFDGYILFLPKRLPEPVMELTSVRKTDNASINLKIQLTAMPFWEEVPKIFNIVFARVMTALKLVEVGRNKYDNKAAVPVPQHKLEVWPGYVTHIAEQEEGLLLMCDVSHRVLRCETCFDIMSFEFKRAKGGPTFRSECIKQIVGQIVLTRYNNNTYRIDDIDWNATPKSTFPIRSGGEMTYVEYYKSHHGITIEDHDQPLLVHRPRPPKRAPNDPPISEAEANKMIMLVPELAYLTGMSDAMRSDFRVMKDIATHTRITPDQRISSLRKFIQRVHNCPEAKTELDGWGFQLDSDIVNLDGRTLPIENLTFGRGFKSSAGPTAEWSRDATTKTVLNAVNISDWMVLFTKRDSQRGADFVDQMKKICPSIGIKIRDPKIIALNDDRTETYLKEIKANFQESVTQLVVTIMPTQRDDRYNAVKKLCYVEQPVASQVINSKTLDPKKLRSVVQKVALQINCKLGGELWAVDIPLKNIMIVGIDSYHEKNKKGTSVAGFVASINSTISRYYSQTCSGVHAGQELADKLTLCFTGALKKYHSLNHTLPEKILVYRDGVGDGQLEAVASHEVEQFYQCFANFETDYKPKLSIVVVQKRINTKLFYKSPKGPENPPPGSVMDHSITKRDYYDFYLVSQHVRQGTVTPTHYVCVHDDLRLPPNHMQRLSYKMTHMYYNWPGTVRVPAPCQYAHKLAYLTGQNICRTPHVDLADKLFYL